MHRPWQPKKVFRNHLHCVFDCIIWFFDLKSNILFLVFIFKKCSKCKPQYLAQNQRTCLTLQGLCLVWPILDPKNTLSFLFIVKRPFWIHVSHKNSKLIFFFRLTLSVLLRLTVRQNLVFRGWNYSKLFNNHGKVAKTRKELLKHYFWLHSGPSVSVKKKWKKSNSLRFSIFTLWYWTFVQILCVLILAKLI